MKHTLDQFQGGRCQRKERYTCRHDKNKLYIHFSFLYQTLISGDVFGERIYNDHINVKLKEGTYSRQNTILLYGTQLKCDVDRKIKKKRGIIVHFTKGFSELRSPFSDREAPYH
ncbi:hypothetical protein C922_05153 [Plasmodium inui San Antonio 1]|uniref:Uncharacterized protein n=1 Tax=Plasmodium inui San Antonio 1 TaxID=1237626 RepID=W6ZYU8_9APIC|nr:hypothetical protein C922_05153 [Plasmodium inui San Antonio 1]EUD64465.1 hypothetical protein C922_05153 [Plasmodium inui San Antonio 1]